MPKELQSIKQFHGGLNTYSDARDVAPEDSSELINFNPRFTGRLKLLGMFKLDTSITKITHTVGASSGPVTLKDGEEYFVFSTDRNAAGNIGDETWVVFVDRSLSQVWMHSASVPAWHSVDGANDGAPYYGIDSKLNVDSNANGMQESASYYSADGAVRICNTQFGFPSYIGGVSAEDGSDVSAQPGASSLWVGHINRKFTSDIVASGWHTLPAIVQPPNSNTFQLGSSQILKTALSIGPECAAGKFGLGITLARNKGDGTLKFQGRKIYATYTFDGQQESLPVEVGTIGLNDLPDAPTNTSLGYDGILHRAVEYGASTIFIDSPVHNQNDGTKKDWETTGTMTCEDNTGQTQTLQYTSASYNTSQSISSLSRSTTTLTLVTSTSLALVAGDKVEIYGNSTSEYNGTRTVATINNSTKTYTFTVANSGATANSATGDARLAGTKLAGVVGWVDNGFCDVNYSLDEVILTSGGDNYTSAPTVTITKKAGTADPDTDAVITASLTNDYVSSLNITNWGDGYDGVPTISFSGGGGNPHAQAICTITGKLSTESMCTNRGGSWTSSSLLDGATITYDPPGEIEERDENLGIQLNLTYKPIDYASNTSWGKTIVAHKYGGPRLTHVNFYTNKYEDDAGTIPESEDFAYMCTFDLQNGYQIDPENWRAWASDTTANQTDQKVTNTNFMGSMFVENYQMRTGKYPDTISTTCRWKTAAVINRRVYAGNVLMQDSSGVEQVFPDRIIKSLPNQFDTFPDYDTLDAAVGDGDEIIYLETFGGKLLEFKKNTLYVLDVTQEPEYVAGTFRFRGIPSKASAAKSDDGICFANKHGVFMFSGEGIAQLSKGKIDDDWASFYDDTKPPIVTYEPSEAVFIITKEDTNEFLYFSMLNKSWTKGSGARHTALVKSNFFDVNGDIYQGVQLASGNTGEINFYKWTDNLPSGQSITDNCSYIGREHDFGDPAVDTVIFNVKMTYKASGTSAVNAEVNIINNDGTGESTNTCTTSSFVGTNDGWKTIEFKPSGGSNRVNCKTARIQVKSTSSNEIDHNFEINDLTIIYRNKRVK